MISTNCYRVGDPSFVSSTLCHCVADRCQEISVVKNLGNGWSKSIVVEIKEVLHFDFRNEAKKSGHLDHPLQSYGQIYFNTF